MCAALVFFCSKFMLYLLLPLYRFCTNDFHNFITYLRCYACMNIMNDWASLLFRMWIVKYMHTVWRLHKMHIFKIICRFYVFFSKCIVYSLWMDHNIIWNWYLYCFLVIRTHIPFYHHHHLSIIVMCEWFCFKHWFIFIRLLLSVFLNFFFLSKLFVQLYNSYRSIWFFVFRWYLKHTCVLTVKFSGFSIFSQFNRSSFK